MFRQVTRGLAPRVGHIAARRCTRAAAAATSGMDKVSDKDKLDLINKVCRYQESCACMAFS